MKGRCALSIFGKYSLHWVFTKEFALKVKMLSHNEEEKPSGPFSEDGDFHKKFWKNLQLFNLVGNLYLFSKFLDE